MVPSLTKNHRRSIRLRDYDYAQPGGYFVTIAAYQLNSLFGEIDGNRVELNDAGRIAQACWQAIPVHFPRVALDAFIVMPNHVHGILIIEEMDVVPPIGRGTACRAPTGLSDDDNHPNVGGHPAGEHALWCRAPTGLSNYDIHTPAEQFQKPVAGSIPTIIRSYKSAVTRLINAAENRPGTIVWQRNYYEHIIRDNDDLYRIRDYILANPENWQSDEEIIWEPFTKT